MSWHRPSVVTSSTSMPPPLLQLASFQSGGQLLYKLHRFYAYLKGGRNEQGGEMAPKILQRESPVLAPTGGTWPHSRTAAMEGKPYGRRTWPNHRSGP